MASSHLSEHDTARAAGLRASLELSGMTSRQLWTEALHLGGLLTPDQVGEVLAGSRAVGRLEHAVLAHALFEVLARIPTGLSPRHALPPTARVPDQRVGR